MGLGSGATQRQDQQYTGPQMQMQELLTQYAHNAYNNSNRPDFQSGTSLYSPSGAEQDVMGSWSNMLRGAQNFSPYSSGNYPYGGGGGQGAMYGGNMASGSFENTKGVGQSGGAPVDPNDPRFTRQMNEGGSGGGGANPVEEWYRRMQGAIGAGSQMPGLSGPDIQSMPWLQGPDFRQSSLQGPNIQGPPGMQGPDIQGPGPFQGPDIQGMGPLSQVPSAEAAIAAAKKNLTDITSPALAQQAAATGGSMDSGAYLEALANAGTAASVPISQQQLGLAGQYGLQSNDIMNQQNLQGNAIRGQYGLQGNDINSRYGLQGNDIRSMYGLQGNDVASRFGLQGNDIRGQFGLQGNNIASTENMQGNQLRGQFGLQGNELRSAESDRANQIRAAYGMQGNDLAGQLAQGRQGQLYGTEMAAPGMGASMSANNLAFENQRNQGLLGLAGTEREGQLQDYLRQQGYLQSAMGLMPTGAFANPATNSRMQSSPGLMESLLGFSQVGKNVGQGIGAASPMGKGG